MPLDHYISQVHLKNFYSPALGSRMYAIRKSDLKSFQPDSKSVCRIEDGSTNSYLREDRAIEDFLREIEPRYNTAISNLASGNVDDACVFTIAGFVAYVLTCSPAAMRLQSKPQESMIESTAHLLDEQGALPRAPEALGGGTLTEFMRNGTVKVVVDDKYTQAIGIASIGELTAAFGNCKWDVLLNDHEDSPFFSSDFPVAIEHQSDPRVVNRIVPLSPTLAVRIRPDLGMDLSQRDLTFSNFGFRRIQIPSQEARNLNRLIVRCAEDVVFYRDDYPWVRPFVEKNRRFRTEILADQLPTASGRLLLSQLAIRETR